MKIMYDNNTWDYIIGLTMTIANFYEYFFPKCILRFLLPAGQDMNYSATIKARNPEKYYSTSLNLISFYISFERIDKHCLNIVLSNSIGHILASCNHPNQR
ncbi:MAG TPA: hypothetical protein VIY08_00645 [Candidatus Nitrosocosmicus sp.]